MIHTILTVGLLQCNCSIFGDEVSKEAMVVDPGADVDQVEAVLQEHGWKLNSIVITHAHIDHIGGAAKLRAATGAPVYMNSRDTELASNLELQAAWLNVEAPENPGIDVEAKEGDALVVGAGRFQILETPGHTAGSISLYSAAEKKLVAGDTLFRDSIGRTDLPGGNSRQILASIHSKLLVLPEDTVVIPGHGATTTVGREKQLNPYLSL